MAGSVYKNGKRVSKHSKAMKASMNLKMGRKKQSTKSLTGGGGGSVSDISQGRFNKALREGNLVEAIEEAIKGSDRDKAFARKTKADIARIRMKLNTMTQEALNKFPPL